MSLTRFRCANSLETPTSGWFYARGGPPVETKKAKGAVRESNPRPLPPEGRIIPLDQRPQRASNEDRTRDLVLTRHMLCQLSYRGESTMELLPV